MKIATATYTPLEFFKRELSVRYLAHFKEQGSKHKTIVGTLAWNRITEALKSDFSTWPHHPHKYPEAWKDACRLIPERHLRKAVRRAIT